MVDLRIDNKSLKELEEGQNYIDYDGTERIIVKKTIKDSGHIIIESEELQQ